MKKKIVALSLCVAMLAIAVIGGTLAYFTDKDQVNNTFTIGNIDIDLYEKSDCDGDGELDEKEYQEYLKYSNIMPGDALPKEAHIRNQSDKNAAYVRVFVLVNNYLETNQAIDEVYEKAPYNYDDEAMQELYNNIFDGWGIDYTKNPIRGSMALRADEIGQNNEGATLLGIDYVRGVSNQYQSGSNGTSYMEDFTYGNPGYYENAYINDGRLYVFYLKLDANADYKLFDGLNVPAEFTNEQMAMFEDLKIDIYADAIQVDNFDSAMDAFNALETANPAGWWND